MIFVMRITSCVNQRCFPLASKCSWPALQFALLLLFHLGQLWAADAPAPSLGLPLDCKIGETCWVANYLDVDSTQAARDFRCHARTYDGHDGVDFAIRDRGVMTRGVAVVASLPGVVKNTRDNMPDVAIKDAASRAAVRGRECGNGVVIDHAGGWQTQYCHLRQGSVGVKPGEKVEAGRSIGQVGLSGHTEFPHLHFALRIQGEIVDPYTGQGLHDGCGKQASALWQRELRLGYETVALYNAGFATGPPDIESIRNGDRSDGPFPANAPALVMWVDLLGVQAGDKLRFRLKDPSGKWILEHETLIDKTQARRFVYAGSKRTASAWPAGNFTGEVIHTRVIAGRPQEHKIDTKVAVQ
jgi:murein DD-endopeptidase MepM/ murein hydrolase activator NlpD